MREGKRAWVSRSVHEVLPSDDNGNAMATAVQLEAESVTLWEAEPDTQVAEDGGATRITAPGPGAWVGGGAIPHLGREEMVKAESVDLPVRVELKLRSG